MTKKNNVTPLNQHKKKRQSEAELDQDILSGLEKPKAVSPIADKVKEDLAQHENKSERPDKMSEIAGASYDAQVNNAPAVLEERYSRSQAEVEAAEAHADSIRDQIADKEFALEPAKRKLIEENSSNGDKQSWLSRTFGGILPEDQIKLGKLAGVSTICIGLGGFGIFEFLIEYSTAIALNPILALPYTGVPIAAGAVVESSIDKIKNAKRKKFAEKLVFGTCLVSLGFVIVGLAGMANDGGGTLELNEGGVPKGLRLAAQIVFEVTGISIIMGRFYEIMRPYWPHILAPSKEIKTLYETLADIEETQVKPRRQYRDRALYWINSYKAHRNEFVLRECASFEVIRQTYDAWDNHKS